MVTLVTVMSSRHVTCLQGMATSSPAPTATVSARLERQTGRSEVRGLVNWQYHPLQLPHHRICRSWIYYGGNFYFLIIFI